MENGAWNLSKHEAYKFKFYDQVNEDHIIYDFSDFVNLSGNLTLWSCSAIGKKFAKMKLGPIILLLMFLSILVLSWHPYGSIPSLLIRTAAVGKTEYKNFEDPLASYRWILNKDFLLFPELFGGNAYFNRVQRPQKHRVTWFWGKIRQHKIALCLTFWSRILKLYTVVGLT